MAAASNILATLTAPFLICPFSPFLNIMTIDPWILTFSALTVLATIGMGFWSAKRSKTAHDFYVAGRSVSVGWNASAISGEYLSAASFMGVAGMVMSSGYDALWYPVCYACGYLFLLLFIAGPLRRFGAYTIPDFAEGRFDSPLFRKIAVVFVLFIGFFYTMPQMKGAGTTLAYIFPGLPYWAGVVLVGAVITLNVALGGMKGITLVQAFQYWLKMFAIAVPIFVLMAVYGHYGKQLQYNGASMGQIPPNLAPATAMELFNSPPSTNLFTLRTPDPMFGPSPRWKLELLSLIGPKNYPQLGLKGFSGAGMSGRTDPGASLELHTLISVYGTIKGKKSVVAATTGQLRTVVPWPAKKTVYGADCLRLFLRVLRENGFILFNETEQEATFVHTNLLVQAERILPAKAPADANWLNPFGPLTTKAAKAAAARSHLEEFLTELPLPDGTSTNADRFVRLERAPISQVLDLYGKLVGRTPPPGRTEALDRLDKRLHLLLTRLHLLEPPIYLPGEVTYRNTDPITAAQLKSALETAFRTNGISVIAIGDRHLQALPTQSLERLKEETRKTRIQSLVKTEKAYALLYTYSLIIALVCGTAGLPHILVRFYTNPNGVAAKRTTLWVMILIGLFYLFPPVFGVLGRNLLPELYAGTGAKGTDKVVLELPRILNEEGSRPEAEKGRKGEREKGGEISSAPLPLGSLSAEPARSASKIPWGSILSGITCAGAFAAFMSTFSGLLVSMTGALAHDVYGHMLRPNSTPQQRLRAFRYCAVIIGAVAIVLGMQVEPFQINFMVGQAFAIAAASYFPLLFVSCWWRGLTMKGAATGMLAGGLCAIVAITLTSFSDLGWFKLADFWAGHPFLRIVCEQPALWTVPLAIGLMIAVSILTKKEIPSDIRMKMLVLHAPETLGLKQEYIQEHLTP